MTEVRVAAASEIAIARLDAWFDTMRGLHGYGGPVAHWWRDSLLFCGAGLDWRYEGILLAYLALFERTAAPRWLEKARRAGDDLVRGQGADGGYRNSQFQMNPGTGGTPHEAAADIALLRLARTLRARGEDGWQTYLETARRNLEGYYLGRLWSEAEGRFWDQPGQPSFVPNKAATLIEALCLLAEHTGRDEYLEHYVRPTAETILAHGRPDGGRLGGAIAQYTLRRTVVEAYFPYYNARCVGGLVAAYEHLGEPRYLDAALGAMRFVGRWVEPDGALPQVVYANGRANRYPQWVAGMGDVLLAAEALRPYGLEFPIAAMREWLLAGQLPSGGFRTARGFGAQVSQRAPAGPPEFRDLLPVTGWADKAFRYLATQLTAAPPEAGGLGAEPLACTFRGRPLTFVEDAEAITLRAGERAVYRWRKGTEWARIGDGWAPTT